MVNVARVATVGATLVGASLIVSCGEKITIPEAEGIPSNSDYILDESWPLQDPTDVIEAGGFIFVTELAGTVTKYNTRGQQDVQATGLVNPTALAGVGTPDIPGQFILVGENGDAGTGPGISVFSRELILLERIDLTGVALSLSALAADAVDWVYASDPESGVVHRFRWTGEDDGWLAEEGIVTRRIEGNASPQFVSEPRGLALDSEGMLLVCDADPDRNWVVRFDPTPNPAPDGTGTLRAFRDLMCPGNPALQSYVLGVATLCDETEIDPDRLDSPEALQGPTGVALDPIGRIYVTNSLNGRGRRFTPDGQPEVTFASPNSGSMAPTRIATWSGTVRIVNEDFPIPGARLFLIDTDLQELQVYEDKRWTQLSGGG